MISKLFAAALVGSLTVMGPVAQAEKNETAMMATKMAAAVPTADANAADLRVFDQPGVDARAALNPDGRKPAPTVAWLLAAGFLGIVVLRRTRSGPMI